MKRVLITGSSGRIGRALHWKLSQKFQTVGIDLSPSSATTIIGDICEYDLILKSFENVDAVFHAAALHAPHVNVFSDHRFSKINVDATEKVCKAAIESGVQKLIFTSTTALYGYANLGKDKAVWIDENTIPEPRTIYHKTKLEAEEILKSYAGKQLSIRVLRMSRCFPEPVNQMAVYRLHRGVDYRDVADAHVLACELQLENEFERFVISGKTPFLKSDLEELAKHPEYVIRERCPELAKEFDRRNWPFPKTIDRVYDSSHGENTLSWKSKRGPLDVIKQFDDEDYEVLPPK